MIFFAIFFISSALLLYSLAIWSEKIKKNLRPWMVRTFVTAFSCDLVGTSMMFYLAPVKFQCNLHSLCGYSALLIMGLHLAWALLAIYRRGHTERYFNRFSIYAWFVWLIAFFSGVPKF